MRRARPASAAGLLLVLALLGSACSVSTPRHGFSAGADGGSITPAGQPGQPGVGGPVVGGSDVVDEPGSGGSSDVATPGSGGQGPSARSTAAPTGGSGTPTASRDTSSRVGVTKDKITISVVAGFSGPFASVNEEIIRGIEIWRDDVNSRNGLGGRKISLVRVDHKDTTDGGVAACKEVERNGSFFAIVPAGVPGLLSAVDCLDRAGFPVVYHEAPTFLSAKWTHAYGGLWTPYDATAKSLASFVKNVDKDGDKKLGVIHINQAYYKRIADSYVAEAKRLGMNVARVEAVEENQSNFVAEMRRMQGAGVENIVLVVALEAVGIWRDSRAIGYSPTWTAMILTLDFLTKAARNLATGVRGLRPYATVDTPAFAKFKARAQELGYTVDAFAGEQFYSYGAGLTMEEALKRAGSDPSRKSLFAGLDSMRAYNNNIQAPITWGPGNYSGTKASFPVVCCDSNWNWKSLGPPKEAF